MNKKYSRLLNDTLIFGLGSIGSKAILFFLVPLYTNYMSEEEYGIADLVFTFAQLIIPFVSLVIFDSVIRFGLSKYEKKENVLLIGILVGFFASIITISITPAFSYYKALSEWKWYLTSYIIVSIYNSIIMNYLKAKDLNKLFAGLSVSQTCVLAILNIYYLMIKGNGIQGYLLSAIISSGIIAIAGFLLGKCLTDLKNSTFKTNLFNEMILFSSPLIFNNVSWWIIHSSDKVMIEALVSASALGIYTVAAKIPSLINVGVSVFQQAWGISTIKEIENDNDINYYSGVFRILFLFVCAICIILVSISKIFINIYVGDDFVSAWTYVPVLLVSALFGAIAAYYGSLYGALKKSTNNMISTLVSAGVNLGVNFILIPHIGVRGAVLSTLLAYFVLALYRMIDVNRFLRIKIDYKKTLLNIVIIIIHAFLVSIDWHIPIISLIIGILFLIINYTDCKQLLTKKEFSND